MATSTLDDLAVEQTWEDVVATHASAASVDVLLQNVAGGRIAVVSGGADPGAASTRSGVVLAPLDSVIVNAAAVWVRSIEGTGKLAVNLV